VAEGEQEDLAELLARRALTEDAARTEAVDRRHAAGGRTARENLADLVDPGSFVEYGRYAIAAQRGRRELEDLIARTPADGLIGGTARVNGDSSRPSAPPARSSPTTTRSWQGPRGRSAIARRTASSS
jgi:acetyl-CoA carboxylase carboxyltransferase component